MDITLLIPHDEGTPDVGGDISAGIEVYEGKLTLAQLVAMCIKRGEAYPSNAVMEFYNEDGSLDGIHVTFHNDPKGDEDEVAALRSIRDHRSGGTLHCTGYEYEFDSAGTGHLSYTTEYKTLQQPPN